MTEREALTPTEAQLALVAAFPDATRFVMVNLLKFRGDDGEARYWSEYCPRVTAIVTEVGGRSVWKGRAEHLVIGAAPHDWDAVWLVAWPSKTEFFAMTEHADFAATQEIRETSLDAMALILSKEVADY